MKKILLSVLVMFLLSSCSFLKNKKDPEISFLSNGPKVDIKEFFNGDVDSFAIVEDVDGKIVGSYTSKVKGEWDGKRGILKKNFYFHDGKKDSRTWLVTDNGDGTFDAIGHDVVEAARGKQRVNAVQMMYSLLIVQDGVKQKVRFEDTFYLINKNSMIGTSIRRSNSGKMLSKSTVSFKKTKKAPVLKRSKSRVTKAKKQKPKKKVMLLKKDKAEDSSVEDLSSEDNAEDNMR